MLKRFIVAILAEACAGMCAAEVKQVLCWGDSVTEGMAMPRDKAYPAQLQKLLGPGYRVLNGGDGGEDTVTIMARQGAVSLATTADIKFPAGVKRIELGSHEDNGFHTPDGRRIKLTAALGREMSVNPVRIGDGAYSLSFTDFRWNTPTNKIMYRIWLTRTANPAAELTIPAGEEVVFASTARVPKAVCEIYFMGANGGWDNKIETLIAQYRAMIARRGEQAPYLVILPYWQGFSAKNKDALKKAFGAHVVEFPVSAELCYQNRLNVHLNEKGYERLARLLHARGVELGYWGQ